MLSIVYYVYSHPPPNEPPMILSVDPILQLPNFIDSFFCIVSIVENKWGEHRFLSSWDMQVLLKNRAEIRMPANAGCFYLAAVGIFPSSITTAPRWSRKKSRPGQPPKNVTDAWETLRQQCDHCDKIPFYGWYLWPPHSTRGFVAANAFLKTRNRADKRQSPGLRPTSGNTVISWNTKK